MTSDLTLPTCEFFVGAPWGWYCGAPAAGKVKTEEGWLLLCQDHVDERQARQTAINQLPEVK